MSENSNGKEVLNDLEFERHIQNLDDRGLMEFTARQAYETRKDVSNNTKRINKLESRDRRFYAISGGAGTFIGATVATIVNYFIHR